MNNITNNELPKQQKKRRRLLSEGNEDGSSSIHPLHNEELLTYIFSFASTPDLLSIDLVSRHFRHIAAFTWNRRTFETFGLRNGKDGWKLGNSLLRKPIMIDIQDTDDFGLACHIGGSPSVVTNGSIVVVCSDDISEYEREFPTPPGYIVYGCVRDAETLNFAKALTSLIPVGRRFNVAICGRVGSEVIVSSNNINILAQRGNDTQLVETLQSLGNLTSDENNIPLSKCHIGNGIQIIGCETHLIAVANGSIFLFRVATPAQDSSLLSFCQKAIAIPKDFDPPEQQVIKCENLAWGNDNMEFIFSYPVTNEVRIWKLDSAVGQGIILPVQTIMFEPGLDIRSLVLTADFVAASSKLKKIHVWERKTGDKLYANLCDEVVSEDEDDADDDSLLYALSMKAIGHTLITTSRLGMHLCVWNMKTGQLLKRHKDAKEQRLMDELPDAIDCTSMDYLECLNGFVCMKTNILVWCFPTDIRMEQVARSIRRRERNILRVTLGFGQGEMFGDNDDDADISGSEESF